MTYSLEDFVNLDETGSLHDEHNRYSIEVYRFADGQYNVNDPEVCDFYDNAEDAYNTYVELVNRRENLEW